MGLLANLPVALAPAMGLNAFFAFVVVGAMGLTWQVGMGAIFWGAVGLLLLTIFRIRYWMIANIPMSLRVGITSGIGLFIAMMAEKCRDHCAEQRYAGCRWESDFSQRFAGGFRFLYHRDFVIP